MKKKGYITLVPSGLYKQYCSDINIYVNIWEELIRKILEKDNLKNKKVLLLPHVLSIGKTNDLVIINRLKKMFNMNKRIISVNHILLPSEARFILGNGFLTITGRMHASISSLQMGVPAIPISYSVKYSRIIGEKLKLNELLIEAKDKNWDKEKVGKILKKVDYINNNYDKLVNKINKGVTTSKEEVHSTIIRIKNILRDYT